MSSGGPDRRGPALVLVLLLMVALIAMAWGVRQDADAGRAGEPSAAPTPAPAPVGSATPEAPAPTGAAPVTETPVTETPATEAPAPAPAAPAAPAVLPGGGTKVFGGNQFLVAYYGTAGTGALGVLGEDPPAVMQRRLAAAAAPFARPGRPVQEVYELIVTVADGAPGRDGDYSHDIDRALVQRYIDAAHRHGALLVLDLQPGRTDFLTVAKRWKWALEDPWVGLALDPEWRMGPRQRPGQVIGSVSAAEVDRTSYWLDTLTRIDDLPQKLFVLHQFRPTMIRDIGDVRAREHLAQVQHVDGFGTPGEKLATYAAVARPQQFLMGFKLFYDEDVRRLGAAAVHRIRPPVRFVSFQ